MVHCGFVICCVSTLAYPYVVVVLFPSSVFVSSAVCLRQLCSLVPSRWGHPGLGRVSVLVSSTRSERRLSLLVSFVFLRDGVTLWVMCVLHPPLISIEGLLSLLGPVPSGCGPRSGAFACPCFPWLGFIVCLCAPLLFSVWLLSALWVYFSWHLSLPRLVGLFADVSSLAFLCYCCSLRPLSLSPSCVPLCCFG